jgi:hypothetical protein
MTWFKSRWYGAPLFVRPFGYFAYRYFFKLGMLDGINGFIYHFLQAFWFRLLVDIKMASLYDRLKRGEYTLADLAAEFGHAPCSPPAVHIAHDPSQVGPVGSC